jgi:tRNA A-37 threonylcarbamoyl transferase component Bud32
MAEFSFKKISKGEFKGVLRGDLVRLLPPDFFEDPVAAVLRADGRVVKESKLRWAAIFRLSEGERVFVKRGRIKGWPEALKFFLLPSKGRKEFFIARWMQNRRLPAPKSFGWMEREHRGLVKESYYLSEAIGSGSSLIDILNSGREVSIGSLAREVKAFHDAGLLHKDLHAGNFLWDGESFFLTDLHRAEIRRSLSLDQRLWSLSHLFHSLRSQSGRDGFLQFMDAYFAADPVYPRKKEAYLQKVLSSMGHLQRRWWRSRTKRCLRESTEFSVKREEGMTIYHRRDFPIGRIQEVVGKHKALIKEKPADLLKFAPESIVSVISVGGEEMCVKEFRYLRWIDRFKESLRKSKGLKAWIAGNGLKIRGIPSLKVMACVERKTGLEVKETLLLMEASEVDHEMDRSLLRGFADYRRKRFFIKAFARWLALLHDKNVFHRDMKACNIVVSTEQEDWRFFLLDLEDLRPNIRVESKELFKNLLQLNTSIPGSVTHRDRLRFFKEYLRHRPIVREERPFLSRLVEKSRERGVVYVSPQGVVEERWN